MGSISRDARLLFILLWTLADDSGRLRGNSRMLASLLFPYDEDAGRLIEGWLRELESQNCIVRYRGACGSNYVAVSNWSSHQKIDKPSESKLPAPDSANILEASRIFSKPLEASIPSHARADQDQGSRIKDQGTGITNVILVGNKELPTASESKEISKGPESSGLVFAMRSGVYDLDEQKLAGYVATYCFDVRRELMKAALWLRDNPSRRPRTRRSTQAFLTRWLNSHDDRAKPSAQLSGRIPNDPKLEAELERTRRIKRERAEAIKNGKVPSLPTE